jgi:ADP-heptose:LPS heptosyltransferase
MNIVVMVKGGIAETLQATPLLRTLRAGDPQARITLLCPAVAAVVGAGIPAVDQVVATRALEPHWSVEDAVRIWVALRSERIDAVVLCSADAHLRWAAYLSAVPRRIGPGGGLTAALLTGRLTPLPGENRAATWLRLASQLGIRLELHAPSYEPGPEARHRADSIIRGAGVGDGRLLIALAPGSGYATTNGDGPGPAAWDPQRYALLANQLAVRHSAGILFLGSRADQPIIQESLLDLGTSAVDLSGEDDIRIIAAVVSRCDLLVGGDTPLLHIAAAVGTPAVGLYGPTDGRTAGPYGPEHRIIQAVRRADPAPGMVLAEASPMDQIRVEDVLASIEASL